MSRMELAGLALTSVGVFFTFGPIGHWLSVADDWSLIETYQHYWRNLAFGVPVFVTGTVMVWRAPEPKGRAK